MMGGWIELSATAYSIIARGGTCKVIHAFLIMTMSLVGLVQPDKFGEGEGI